MWAHYASSQTGFVVEIDEEALCDNISIGYIEDVQYAEETGLVDWESIRFALGTKKPRHSHFVQSSGFKNAYFTKNNCWSYEEERRLVTDQDQFDEAAEMLLLSFPKECVSSVIAAVGMTSADRDRLKAVSKKFKCPYYEMRIGRTSCVPFFVGLSGGSFRFIDSQLDLMSDTCGICGEPLTPPKTKCLWCRISPDDEEEAFRSNPFNIMDRIGGRDEYGYGFTFSGLRPIGKLTKQDE